MNEWNIISEDLNTLPGPPIPRLICPYRPATTQLLIFCDASPKAYCAVAYLRASSVGSTHVSFLMGKTRVAPVKDLTIPRSELPGVHLGSVLVKTILRELTSLPPSEVYIWTDSLIVLSWLKTQRTLPIFVRNRINAIQSNINQSDIKYVPTLDNPADYATKRTPSVQSTQSKWLAGPSWISSPPESWPTQPQTLPSAPEDLTVATDAVVEDKFTNHRFLKI
ncbi:unnamed protein product [Bursaphelenchus okinawaensis]|uniref:RNase H domain-containing protein n=1 Tax=Bursaphelenchus okinawaensis TaxID=465554 RepID=A0A811KG89_9BILA|nr:unnamed protein product [Bursaphelenchus okinawaensis]CAG9101682.1 unnamed protein product [Bursaphelenchus okinawaensis]